MMGESVMQAYLKAREGGKLGIEDMYLGGKNLVGMDKPGEAARREAIAAKLKELGTPGTVGSMASTGLATAPIGGVAGVGGKLLGRAAPQILKKAMELGGKTMNVGNIVKGAATGAATQGIIGDPQDQGAKDRIDDLQEGAFYGGIIPAAGTALAGGGKVLKKAWNAVSTGADNVQKKAIEALQRRLGPQEYESVLRKIEHAPPNPILPKTTAALTESPPLGALERGGVTRGHVDYQSKKEAEARAAWDYMTRGNSRMRSQAGKGMLETFERNGIPVTPNVYGDDITGRVPGLTDQALRTATGKASAGMSAKEQERAMKLADELRMIETARSMPGNPNIDHGSFVGAVSNLLATTSAATGSSKIWKVRQVFNSLTGGKARDAVEQAVDEAVADPAHFKSMAEQVAAKIAAGKTLTGADKLFAETVMATSRANAVEQSKPTER